MVVGDKDSGSATSFREKQIFIVIRPSSVAGDSLSTWRCTGTPIERPSVQARADHYHRILLVDDNVDAAESGAALLRLDGHEVQLVGDSSAALRTVKNFCCDVVLLDIGVPGMDGYEVAQRLRTMPALADAVLITLSGYGGEQHATRCEQAGFNCHLAEPANLEAT